MLIRISPISWFLATSLLASASYSAKDSAPHQGCGLMLVSDLATPEAKSGKSTAEKVFGALPFSVRKLLGRTSPQALALHEKTLHDRIAELLPPEVTAQMAAMFQTSHDYVLSWLPVLPKSVELGQKKFDKYNEAAKDLGLDYFVSDAQRITWGQRLKEAHELLLELAKLQEARHAHSNELGVTYLRIALLHSYCYGFQSYLVGRRSPRDLALQDQKGHLTVSGLAHFRKALEIYERQLGPQHEAILTLKYMMLRHANNGVAAHSNSQYRTLDGQRLAPNPIMWEFVDAAKTLSAELWHELSSDPTPSTFSSRRMLFYYVIRELQRGSYYIHIPSEKGSLFAESPSRKIFRGNALDLLLFIAKEAPKAWIDDQLNDPDRKKFLHYLITDSRWFIQTELKHPGWELLYDVQMSPTKYNYESLLSILNKLGLLQSDPLPGPTKAME